MISIKKIITIEFIYGFVIKCILHFIGIFVKKNNNIWIFGQLSGNEFSGNPKYLFINVLKKHKNIRPIWFTKKRDVVKTINDFEGEAYLFNSLKALYYGLIAKVYIHSYGRDDILNYSKINAIFVNLYHGMVIKKLKQYYRKDDLDIASSDITKEVRKKIFINTKKLIITGEPRYDIFYEKIDRITILKKYKLETFHNKVIISYLPTYRKERKNFRPLFFNFNQFSELNDVVLFEKCHYIDKESAINLNTNLKNIVNISNICIDTQELLFITDILITDYSCCFVDFLLMENPIIFYAYDLEEYTKTQGFYYDYEEVTPGIKAYSELEVFQSIKKYLKNPDLDKVKRIKVKDMFHKYQDGNCSERVYREIVNLLKNNKK